VAENDVSECRYGCLMQVNQGFDRLRQYVRLPGLGKKKLSKVDTLRAAVDYIKYLQWLLAETETDATSASTAALHCVTEQLLSTQHQQLPQLAVVDDVSSSAGFFFASLLQTGISSSIESHGASTSGMLATASTPLEPAMSYSTGSACLPLADVNNNSFFANEPTPPWSSKADIINLTDGGEQQRRLHELTAWLME